MSVGARLRLCFAGGRATTDADADPAAPPAEAPPDEFAAGCRGVRRRQLAGIVLVGLGLVLVVVLLAIVPALGIRFNPMLVVPIVFLVAGGGAFCMQAKCPRCGKPFFGFPLRFFWARTCHHCRLDCRGNR